MTDLEHEWGPDDEDRRMDGLTRDRIGFLVRGLRKWQLEVGKGLTEWQRDVDLWRAHVDRRITRRSALVTIAMVAFALGFVAAGGALRGLYERDAQRAQDSVRIIQQFQDSREQNANAACADENALRSSLQQLGRDLGGRRLERAIIRRFPRLDCALYVHQTLTTGRRPQPTPLPTVAPTP